MRADQKRIRAHLALAFDDADGIETRPVEEVRAELAALGVDPTASIRLAEKLLRHEGRSPAARLLNRIERLDDVDAEIEAFETGDVDDLRLNLPTDQAKTVRLDKPAGRPSGARRVSFLGWGGSLVGIAACLLLYIAVRPDRLEERAPSEAPADLADLSSLSAPEMTEAPEMAAPNAQAARGAAERPTFTADQRMFRAERSGLADTAAGLAEEAAPSPASFALPSARGAVVGVLVVEDRTPRTLHALAGDVADQGLSVRLEEARQLAAGRTVLALMRFDKDGEESVSALIEDPASGFELIDLGEAD